MPRETILTVLQDMISAGQIYGNVPETDGKTLRVLAECMNAQYVVEIGTATGISGLWLAMALEATGGHLMTFESHADRAAEARRHFRDAGVNDLVTVVEGDAHITLGRIDRPIDLAFIDADKDGYCDYLHALLPRLRTGGLLLAHNFNMVPDYLAAVNGMVTLETIFCRGLAISLKTAS
jgi:predicted O-methyltransferase YrrM